MKKKLLLLISFLLSFSLSLSAGEKADALDFIFNNQTLGETEITIKRSEWNKLCDNYRYFFKNENSVHAESYVYTKDGKTWTLNDVGLRLRGNTSRYCPQGVDNGRSQDQMNANWNSAYYDYAEKPNKDYRQVHFKVSFGKYSDAPEDKTMADCLKGMALKRLDHSCGREIFCYDLFRKNGIWTAPRASHTRLIINIIEDTKKSSSPKITKVDYGVYEMFEEINTQSLKARSKKENAASNAWKSSNGYLWKCGAVGGASDLTDSSGYGMGIEDVKILFDEKGKPVGKVANYFPLDLKTKKKKFEEAKTELRGFIAALNKLPQPADESDEEAIAQIKEFYEKWFDVDFFIKTYAINLICGMDDDYWGNSNNYYLYFDTGSEKSTQKVYFIPFDYDNTLGCSITEPGFKKNPFEWGLGKKKPLLDKLLCVPEYKEKFKQYLLDLSDENSLWNYERCSALFMSWKDMLSPYLNSPDLNYYCLGVNSFQDYTWQPSGYSLVNKENNIYEATHKSFEKWFNGTTLQVYEILDNSYSGIKIGIKNIPEDAVIRDVFINDKLAAETDKKVFAEEFGYPYTKPGAQYTVKVVYKNKNWGTLETASTTIIAKSGEGEFCVKNKPSYSIKKGVLKFSPEPELQIGKEQPEKEDNWKKYYILELTTTDWQYQSWNYLGASANNFDFNGKNRNGEDVIKDKSKTFIFSLYYVVRNEKYGDYRLMIYENDFQRSFKLK